MGLLLALLCLVTRISYAQIAAPASSPPVDPQPASSPHKTDPQINDSRTGRASEASPDGIPAGGQLKSPTETSDKRPVADHDAPDAELIALRDEIEAAPNEQERVRLQLQLVDRLVARGVKPQAVQLLNSMVGVDRFDPQGFYNIGNALARLGDAAGAVSSYRKAIDQRKGRYSRALNNLGVVLLRQGRWDEAYDSFMKALRLESFRYAEASYNLGRLYAARGESDLATREWRRAVATDPEHTAAANALARSGNLGNIRVARPPASSPVSNTSASGTTPPLENERPALHGSAMKSSRASSSAPFTLDPQTYSFLQRARAARDRSRNDDAVEDYRRVIARTGGYFPPANLELGYALISLQRIDEAIASLLPVALKDGTRLPISYYHLARLYETKGELRLAEDNFSRAVNSYRDSNAQFFLDLSRVREKLGDLSGALASLEQYVSAMEHQGLKPQWSDERLAALRQRLAASPAQPKP